jgi:high-affinity nickel permease
MDFEFLFNPLEEVDSWLTGLLDGAPLPVALGIAFVLGLRHASDPDHLVATTSLVAADGGDTRGAVRLGAWWGVGHGLALLAIGLPLILLKSELPVWLEQAAEKVIGLVILLLAARVILKWVRGDFHAGRHAHDHDSHHHLRHGAGADHGHRRVRSPQQAFAIGTLHGLAGTGAVVVLLIAALPTQVEAAAALAVFAPMTMASMAVLTGAFTWLLTRPVLEPIYRTLLIPSLGVFGVIFGLWYTGLL